MIDTRPIPEILAELQAMAVPELVERYQAVFGKPPRTKHRAWLWRRIAWKVQEQRFGGLSEVAKRRLDELIAEIDIPELRQRVVRGKVNGKRRGGEPPAGTVLKRTWKGQEIHARSVEGGWEHEGVLYRSLTALAQAVTGTHTSGPAFFGLAKGAKR